MEVLNNDVLTMLIQERKTPCVSIFTPTHREWNEMNQDILRFKNQIKETQLLLLQNGMKEPEIQSFLKDINKLTDDREFWNHQQEGLAVFISRDEFYHLHLPFRFREKINMSNRFYTKPLLPVFNGNKDFFILSLDLHNIRLFRGYHYSVKEINLENTPVSIEDALDLDNDWEKKMQYRAQISTGNTHRANFHGHGARNDATNRKRDIHRFFEMVTEGLMNILKDEKAPLVLAGVEQNAAIFREVNKYPNLFENFLKVDVDFMQTDDLYHRSAELLEPHFQNDAHKELEKFGNMKNSDKASDKPDEIIKAAYENRIASLLVNPDEEIWGRFDSDNYSTVIHWQKEDGDEDLVDLAATQTLLRNGTIFTLPGEKLPNGSGMAAVYRF
jgi:hypothetical protein